MNEERKKEIRGEEDFQGILDCHVGQPLSRFLGMDLLPYEELCCELLTWDWDCEEELSCCEELD